MINYEGIKNKLNIELLEHQKSWLELAWYEDFFIAQSEPLAGKSYFLAVYALLKLLDPVERQRVVITAPTHRQVRNIGSYISRILEHTNIPVTTERNSKWDRFVVNGNSCFCATIEDGSTLRGLRSNVLLVDDYQYIDKDLLDPVICGFMAVSQNPIAKIKGIKSAQNQIIYTERL